MKPSYYNVLVPIDCSSYVIYNTHYQTLAVLSGEERQEYDNITNGEIEGIDSDFVQALAEQNFIVEDPEEEANWLEYEFEKYKHNSRYFELTICPTLDCNFRCPYCYEKKRPGYMSKEVQDALIRFLIENYEEKPFKQLRIVWYGGEPLLEPKVIKSLSKAFIDFCDSHEVIYQASLMTNGLLADEKAIELFKQCRITSVQVSFGGKGECHDKDRICITQDSTYQTVLENTIRLAESGIYTHVEFVVDHNNYNSCLEVAADLGPRENIYFHTPFRKADYNGDLYFSNEHDEQKPMFNYLEAKDIDRFTFEYFMLEKPSAERLAERLKPIHHYCGCSMDRFFVIDELGYVYKCIVDVDKPQTHALFNICDPTESRNINWPRLLYFANENPAKRKGCRTCRLYPICNGCCFRNNEIEGGDFYRRGENCRCQTFTYTIEDFVLALYKASVAEGVLE